MISFSYLLAESLRTRIAELRTTRASLEKRRDEVIKQLKYVHQRITLRRRDGSFRSFDFT